MREFRLLPHNKAAYAALATMLDEKSHAAVIQATGTGKSYIAMQLIRDNPGSRILFITSYKANLTRFISDLGRYGIPSGNVVFALYRGLKNVLDRCPFDIVITDEFHRLGAPGFGRDFKAVMERSPNARLVGFSATPVRHLDNQRNMAQELFDGDIAWELSLDDAILDGLLPAPDYITAAYSFEEDIAKAEKRLEDNGYSDEKKAKVLIEKARRTLENAGGLRQVFEDRLRNRNGRYIVFCRDWRNMKAMMELVDDWFGFCPERHVYRLYSNFRNHKDLDGFAADDSDALKLLFSIDMLNEGVHLAGIDGVIMLRPTQSPNVYFQQLGRALSVTATKVPQVFDIVDNFAGMSIAQKFWTGLSQKAKSEGRPFAGRFEVAANQIGLLDIIRKLEELMWTWDDWYHIAEEWFEEHGADGWKGLYRKNPSLNNWCRIQKKLLASERLENRKAKLLTNIGITPTQSWSDISDQVWDENYQKLSLFIEKHGRLPHKISEDGKCDPLYAWVSHCLRSIKDGKLAADKSEKLHNLLSKTTRKPELTSNDEKWFAKLEQVQKYINNNGRLPDKTNANALRTWIARNRKKLESGELSSDKTEALSRVLNGLDSWSIWLEKTKKFKEKNGRLPCCGNDDENPLYQWILRNKTKFKNGLLPPDKAQAFLSVLGSDLEQKPSIWWQRLEELRLFKKNRGHLPRKSDGNDAILLFHWTTNNKGKYRKGLLPANKAKALSGVLGLDIPEDCSTE